VSADLEHELLYVSSHAAARRIYLRYLPRFFDEFGLAVCTRLPGILAGCLELLDLEVAAATHAASFRVTSSKSANKTKPSATSKTSIAAATITTAAPSAALASAADATTSAAAFGYSRDDAGLLRPVCDALAAVSALLRAASPRIAAHARVQAAAQYSVSCVNDDSTGRCDGHQQSRAKPLSQMTEASDKGGVFLESVNLQDEVEATALLFETRAVLDLLTSAGAADACSQALSLLKQRIKHRPSLQPLVSPVELLDREAAKAS